tara:strand:- start:34 stop:1050 length:1017 start_codon:yes stop_codon:yes gene_type:complete
MTEAVLKKFFKESKPQLIPIGSQTPSQILDTLKTIEITSDTVIITNGDVWRYANIEHDIFNHNVLKGKTVLLQTSGYSNIKHNNLHYHISFPMWYWERTHCTEDFIPLSSDIEYGFSCLNNATSIDRFILGHNLYVNNLLEDMIFSQNLVETNYEILEQDLNTLDLPKFHEYKNLLPILLDDYKDIGPINFKNFRNQPGWVIPLDHPAFSNAYCFISVESECEDYPYSRNINLPIVTEKSYKSFITRQIPLVVGARGHYAYLKDLGFEMMEDFLPEGYDDMPFLKKVDAIVSTVAKGKEFAKDFYFSHLPEIQHNYELVNSTKVEELVLKRIHTLLTP